MTKLYQCPYDEATACDLTDGCLFCEKFEDRLTEIKYTEKDMDDAYDKGFSNGNQRDRS